MFAVVETATGVVLHLLDSEPVITESGMTAPIKALDIRSSTHHVEEVDPPELFVPGALVLEDGEWLIVNTPLYEAVVAAQLEILKAERLDSIRALTDAKLAEGAPIEHDEQVLRVALDDGSRADMGGMATTAVAAAGGAVPWPASYQLGWITIENLRIPLPTPADGLALAALVGDYYAQVRQHARDLKDAVLAAEDEAALEAIDIHSGWPGL